MKVKPPRFRCWALGIFPVPGIQIEHEGSGLRMLKLRPSASQAPAAVVVNEADACFEVCGQDLVGALHPRGQV